MNRIRTLSGKVLMSMLSIIMVLFILLAGIFSYWSYQQMITEYRNLLRAYVMSVEKVFSREMEEMQKYAETVYASPECIAARNKKTYEVVGNMALYAAVRDQMAELYQSLYVLNESGKTTFYTSTEVSFPKGIKDHIEEVAKNQKAGGKPIVWKTESVYKKYPDVTLISLFVQNAEIGNDYHDGSVVINMDAKALSRSLFEEYRQSDFSVYIVDENGLIVAHNDLNAIGQTVQSAPHIQKVFANKTGAEQIEIDGQQMEMVYLKTEYSGFYVIAQSKLFYGLLDAVGLVPTAMLVLSFIISLVLVYYVCKKMFVPFDTLTRSMRRDTMEEFEIGKVYDDIQFLERYHRLMIDYVHRMKRQRDDNIIVKSLLQDTWNENMQRFLVNKKVLEVNENYCVVIVQLLPDEVNGVQTIDAYIRRREDVEKVLLSELGTKKKCSSFELGLNKILFILSDETINKTQRDDFIELLNRMQEEIANLLRTKVIFGVSDYVSQQTVNCDALYKQAKKQIEMRQVEKPKEVMETKSGSYHLNLRANQDLLEKVVDYINENYHDSDMGVSGLSQHFDISKDYLGKLFQEFAGKSILNYLMDVRMKHAKILLMTSSEMSMAQIAESVGFSNSAYFTTCFKKYYGVSPSKMRELGDQ